MGIWNIWTSLLSNGLTFFSAHFGVSEAIAIICLTLVARVVLMPLALAASFRAELNKQKMNRIKPELEALKVLHKDNSSELAAATMKLYKANGVTFFDRLTILNMGSQGIFGFGIYQVLGKARFTARFLWIADIAKPNLMLTLLVGALMLLSMAVGPGAMAEPSMIMMLLVSVTVTVIAIAAMPSAVGIYWATSNAFSVGQTLILRGLISRQKRTVVSVD